LLLHRVRWRGILQKTEAGNPPHGNLVMQQVPGFAAVALPRASRQIRTIEDIKGAKIGVSAVGGEAQRLLNYILLQHGIRPEEISVINLGPSVTQFPSLERGLVDVVLARGVAITYLERRHADLRILFDTRTPALTKAAVGVEEVPESVLIAQEDWLRSNPDTARHLAGAFQCALGWIQDHDPEQIRQALPDSCRSPDTAADLDAISSSKRMLCVSGRMTRDMHEGTVRISGVAAHTNLENAYTSEFLGR